MSTINARVICIDDSFNEESRQRIPILPQANEIYTIRDSTVTRNGKAVWLKEIRNPKLRGDLGWFEASFAARRFRVLTPEEELALQEDEMMVA